MPTELSILPNFWGRCWILAKARHRPGEAAASDPNLTYPLCSEGQRACPPEDCGGIYGYCGLVEAIGDPDQERHEKCWIGLANLILKPFRSTISIPKLPRERRKAAKG